ncbi:MAG: UvrD-helicase domain-containing protein, partial [Planctomycetes bacterium]|nr:UvrD-helicase domain-containing protein [Planctomycetota bacterium]
MTPDSNFLEDLNRPQQEAVAHPGGPLMVIAGAGSGKTRVITYRIAGLIRRSVPRDRILAITFTNKAAREMRDRAERLVGPGDLWISTFHSFCARILRRHIDRIPPYTSKFSIYDRDDQVSLLRSILPDLDIDPRLRPPALFLRIIGRAKNELRGPDELAQSGRMRGPGREEALRVYRAYEGALRDRNALDFDDLLLLTVRLFEGAPDVAAFYQEKFLHLLVDEYQDTNHAQYRLGEILSARHRNITITGDPDQSIYAWRGADIRNILRFEEDFPDARIVKLEQNYRSTKRILAAAQGLIAHNKERKEKDLWTQNPEGVPVRVVCATDPSDEGRRVAEAIAVRARAGASYGECAVFYRVNAQSRSIEMALFDAGIPYVVVGGVAFYARREIKDLLAYLRAAVNPRDDESLKRIINVPARGIGQKSLERLREWARERGVPLR